MNRREFLALIVLTGCKCELEDMNIQKLNWWKSGNTAQSEILEVPDGFGWTPPFTITKTGSTYSSNFDPTDYDFSGTAGVTYYFNDVTGSDVNDGLTPSTPKKNINTIITALNSSPPAGGAVFIIQTDYKNIYGASTTAIGFNLVIKSDVAGTKRRFSKEVTDGSTALVSGACYRFTRAAAAAPLDLTWLDSFGKPKRFAQVSSSANCIATPGSYFIQGGNDIQFHLFDSRVPDANVRYMRAGSVLYFTSTAVTGIYTQDLIFEGGTLNSLGTVDFNSIEANNAANFVFNNCEFGYGEYALKIWRGNSAVSNDTRIYLKDCDLYHAAKDGHNIHNTPPHLNGDVAPNVYEENCTLRYNGYTLVSGGGTPNNNGSSMHDGGKIIRLNCEYTYNQNRNIHDVTDSTATSSQAWILKCVAGYAQNQISADDSIDFNVGQNAGTDVVEWWMDGCSFVGNSLKKLRVNTGSTCKYKNMDLTGWDNQINGTLTTY
jgi:hypothetical protein